MEMRRHDLCEVFCNVLLWFLCVRFNGWWFSCLCACVGVLVQDVTEVNLDVTLCTLLTYWLLIKSHVYMCVECRKKWWHTCMCVGYGGVELVVTYSSLFVGILNERNCTFTPLEEDSQTSIIAHTHTHRLSRIWLVLPDLITRAHCD